MIVRFQALMLSLIVAAMAAYVAKADSEQVSFERDIQPIFQRYCNKCHGEKKAEAELRLDSAEAIKEFGLDLLIVPGKSAESELFSRVTLPEEDDARMPKGSAPLPKSSIEVLKRWIDDGATFTDNTSQASTQEKNAQRTEPQVSPASAAAIQELSSIGARVTPVYSGSNLLSVSFHNAGGSIGNEELLLLLGIAEQTTWLDLSGPKIIATDFSTLSQLSNLARLNLSGTRISDASLASLSNLKRLERLNLYETKVSDASVRHLQQMKALRKVYAANTNISYQAAMNLQNEIPGLEVDLGWNHPQVAAARLAGELVLIRKTRDDATLREMDARSQKESAVAREAEVLQELASIAKESSIEYKKAKATSRK